MALDDRTAAPVELVYETDELSIDLVADALKRAREGTVRVADDGTTVFPAKSLDTKASAANFSLQVRM